MITLILVLYYVDVFIVVLVKKKKSSFPMVFRLWNWISAQWFHAAVVPKDLRTEFLCQT